MKRKKNHSIEYLRVLAILSVVVGHSCIIYDYSWTTYVADYDSYFFRTLKSIINLYQMPLFFAISGFLFYNTVQHTSLLLLIKKKFVRLIIPFLFVSVFWLVPIRYIANYPPYNNNIWEGYRSLLSFDVGHLWFLPTLFLIFIISFCIIRLNIFEYSFSNKKKLLISFLFIAILIIIVYLNGFSSIAIINYVVSWLPSFFIGYLIAFNNYYFESIQNQKTFSVISLFILIILFKISSIVLHYNLNHLISICIIILLFLCSPNKRIKFIECVDKNSLGIYLFHSPVIYILYDNLSFLHPFILVPLNFITSIAISLLLIFLIRKFNMRKLIGE